MYHLSIKNKTRRRKDGGIRSAVYTAAYRAGMRLRNDFEGGFSDYTYKDEVLHTEMVLPEGAPDWMADREKLWNAVDAIEKRKDSRLAREVEFALPRELPKKEWIACTQAYAQHFAAQGLVVDVAIHEDGTRHNPHVHFLLTTRHVDGDGFGKKNRETNGRIFVVRAREKWAEIANASLEAVGSPIRIDPRSHAARGIKEPPTRHRGPNKQERLQRRIERTERMKQLPIVSIKRGPLGDRDYYRDDDAEVFRAVDNPNDRIAFDDQRVARLVDRPARTVLDDHDEPERVSLEREAMPEPEPTREEIAAREEAEEHANELGDHEIAMKRERRAELLRHVKNHADDPSYVRKLEQHREEQRALDDRQRKIVEELNRYDPAPRSWTDEEWQQIQKARKYNEEHVRIQAEIDRGLRSPYGDIERDLPVPDPDGRPIPQDDLDEARRRMIAEMERERGAAVDDVAARLERERLEREREERQACEDKRN